MAWSTASKSPAYNTAEYRNARDACLKTARWRCQRRFEGICIGAASQANHRQGLASDPHHRDLEAICKPCHAVVTARQGHAAQSKARPADPKPAPRTRWDDEDDTPPF